MSQSEHMRHLYGGRWKTELMMSKFRKYVMDWLLKGGDMPTEGFRDRGLSLFVGLIVDLFSFAGASRGETYLLVSSVDFASPKMFMAQSKNVL